MKKVWQRIMALLLCISVVPTAFAVEYGTENNPDEKVYAQNFADVPTDHWAFQYIAELVERGAINGYPDGNFYPNETVTRDQFAKIMVKAAGLTAAPASSSSFADVPLTHWASPFVETAKAYMTAYKSASGQLLFKPNEGALREDIAVAVVMLKGYDTRLADLSLLNVMFSDVDTISEAAKPYVALAVENGIISGYPGKNGEKGTFGGQRTIARSEAAAILWRAFQYGDDTKVIPGEESGEQTAGETQSPDKGSETGKYKVETVTALPGQMDDYIVTKTGEVYFLKDNRLHHIVAGNTEQLYDGSTDYYEEITIGEFVKKLKNGPEENYWSGIDTFGYDESELFYFDSLSLKKLAYDSVNDKVYVLGITNVETSYSSDFYAAQIYEARQMETPVATVPYGTFSSGVRVSPSIACAGDVLLYMSMRNAYGEETAQLVDPSTGQISLFFEGFYSDRVYLKADGAVVSWWWGEAEALNLTTGAWTSLNIVAENLGQETVYTTYRDKMYYTAEDGIYRLDAAGTNRVKGVLFLAWDALNVQDGKRIGKIEQLCFDDSGDIVFADMTNRAVRRISL